MAKVKTDSEALEDMKAQNFLITKLANISKAALLDDIEKVNAEWDDFMSVKIKFPNTRSKNPPEILVIMFSKGTLKFFKNPLMNQLIQTI